MSVAPERHGSPFPLRRDAVTLALLTGLTVVSFVCVEGLSRIYFATQDSLAQRWSARGAAALQSRNYKAAVDGYRTALLYARGNDGYQLGLAQALLGEGRIDEAYGYLRNLHDEQPENGLVNLELARIASSKGDRGTAIRFYHNAIYATWPANEETERENARLELIRLFLRNHAQAQAQSELIALAANMSGGERSRTQIAGLFLEAQDYAHALSEYRASLRSNPRDAIALAGAGRAAFELGHYSTARRYLADAAVLAPHDKDSAGRLRIADLVIAMDPFRQQIRVAERNRVVVKDFAAAGTRLTACLSSVPTPATAQLQTLEQSWSKLKRKVTSTGLRRNPDLVDAAMELVFDIERQTAAGCGPPSDTDTALVLIAKMHEGI